MASAMLEKSAENTAGCSGITASIGQPVSAGSWSVTVLSVSTPDYVKVPDYVKLESSYYMPSDCGKIVAVKLKIENIGKDARSPSVIRGFKLVTDAHKVYNSTYYPGIPVLNATSEVQAKALAIEPQIDQLADKLGVNWTVEPGASEEGYVVFEIPANENPVEFCYSIGIGCCVAVKLG